MINRHSSRCNRERYQRRDEFKCSCGVSQNDPHWYKSKLAICEKLQTALVHCMHYKEFTKRVEKFFRDAVPKYSVAIATPKEGYKSTGIRVYGEGIEYDNAVDIYWYASLSILETPSKQTWQEAFNDAMARETISLQEGIDIIEKEDMLVARFDELNKKAIDIIRLAAAMVESPSGDLANAYPLLFKSNID